MGAGRLGRPMALLNRLGDSIRLLSSWITGWRTRRATGPPAGSVPLSGDPNPIKAIELNADRPYPTMDPGGSDGPIPRKASPARHVVLQQPCLVSCLRNRWRLVAQASPWARREDGAYPPGVCDGRTTKPGGLLGATRRAAGLFAPHVVARSSQTPSGLLVARASWDTKIPRGETPAISETRHEVSLRALISWRRSNHHTQPRQPP